jgi:predicted Zn-dependent protease
VALLAGGCTGASVAPIGARPGAFTPTSDERALWAQAEAEEQKLVQRTRVHHDPALGQYLDRLAERVTPPAVRAAGGPRVTCTVILDPTLNAFAMPGGRLFLHTGLLAALEDEAELAGVLAHEIAHVTGRHALERSRETRGQARVANVMAIATSISGTVAPERRAGEEDPAAAAMLSPAANAIVGLGLPIMTTASITGYGPDREREADEAAVQGLLATGHGPRALVRFLERLRAQVGQRGPIERFFLGTPQRLAERRDTLTIVLRTTDATPRDPEGATPGAEDFAGRLRPAVRENAALDVRAGRFALAQEQLDRVLAATPHDPVAHVYYGDLVRFRSQRAATTTAQAEAARRARDHYERAAALDPALAAPHRQLGLLYYETKDVTRAREAFEKYLALAPEAPDAARIKAYLGELTR